ncbi:hypothetical protein ACJIZ3_009770 [Penstemon smallii]|uniref:BHLH domain-containing protein n=1 Tax=Penstemon smallii TaxID=265156 RepID=A0ABD3TDG2_9LAMI
MEKSNLFFNPNWENSMDQNDPFESALSSMVSSPTASNCNNIGGENIVLKELIGKLGGICDNFNDNNNNSTNNSTYSTPLNSPPKFNGNFQNPRNHFPLFSSDPGFVERAARFSPFSAINSPKFDDSDKNSTPINKQFFDPGEKSSVSGEIGLNLQIDANSRKRKPVQRGKGKGIAASAPVKDANVVGSENSDLSAKRSKSDEKNEKQSSKDKSKAPDSPKDYIHVRARRGQATDAHSLAERVRREKIGERMQVLQDLVPGCNKVTGKAVMLDEIINYVQSLQRQVEFLSMKLTTINPVMELNAESVFSKDMIQTRGSLPHEIYPSDGYPYQSQQNLCTYSPNGTEASFQNASFGRNQSMMDIFSGNVSQVSTSWEDDLHSVVQKVYGQNQSQNFHG